MATKIAGINTPTSKVPTQSTISIQSPVKITNPTAATAVTNAKTNTVDSKAVPVGTTPSKTQGNTVTLPKQTDNKGGKKDPDNGNNNYYGGGGGGSSAPAPAAKDWASAIGSDPDAIAKYLNTEAMAQANKDLMAGAGIDGDVSIGRIDHIDTEQEEAMLKQITDAQKEQAELQTQHTVNQGISELQRNMEDSQDEFQTQLDQIASDEQRALDNQVLYNEARGDKGGIGQAQYNTIQNTAATNRLTVQKQQTKLASDTARQIADLRAQGEFEKANQLLSITQNYLGQLMDLYTWAKETNLGIDEFNTQIDQWEENYKLSLLGAEIDVASATGAFSNGTPTYAAWMQAQQDLANSGQALMQAGIAPTAQQLEAMGMTQDQAVAYLTKYYPNG